MALQCVSAAKLIPLLQQEMTNVAEPSNKTAQSECLYDADAGDRDVNMEMKHVTGEW